MRCMYCSMLKGTPWAKAVSNSEKIEPITLVVIGLHLSEGISHLLSLSVSQSLSQSIYCMYTVSVLFVCG